MAATDPFEDWFVLSDDEGQDHEDHGTEGGGADGAVLTETREEVKKPRLYKVLIHNDDYTPQEFVVNVLMRIFNMDSDEAYRIMMKVHMEGIGVAGVYSFEVAETKSAKVQQAARQNEFPLRSSLEPE